MNLFDLPGELPDGELFEPVAEGADVLVERIVLLRGEAELAFADGSRLRLSPGDHLLLAAGVRHRVERTSADPPCVWLAVHARGLGAPGNAPA